MSGKHVDAIVRFAESAECGQGAVLLGRDVRTDPGAIAGYCLSNQEPVFEDLATLVEGMAYVDRAVLRPLPMRWGRTLKIVFPVFDFSKFQTPSISDALVRSAKFPTGDDWHFEFIKRVRPFAYQQRYLALPPARIRQVVPFSDGLDSFAQARLSSLEFGSRHIMLVRSGLSTKGFPPDVHRIRIPRSFGGAKLRETTYRTRPLVFFTMAAITAVVTGARAVAIGESGQGSIGPACVPLLGEWPFHSTHPAFISSWSRFINRVLGSDIRFEQPQVWKTKGEVLKELRVKGIEEGWQRTRSCSGRPLGRLSRNSCGFCGGCLLRFVSAHAAGMERLDVDRAFDVASPSDSGCDRSGRVWSMQANQREVAVTAISDMDRFARLSSMPDFYCILDDQARLIDPDRPEVAREGLIRLQRQHEKEWDGFLEALPQESWVLKIVNQL